MNYLNIVATLILLMLVVIAVQLHLAKPVTVNDQRNAISMEEQNAFLSRLPLVRVTP